MDIALIVVVSVLVGGVVLAFYMDWLGLWVSKEEMRRQIARAKERVRELGKQVGHKAPETGAKAEDEAGTEASGIRL